MGTQRNPATLWLTRRGKLCINGHCADEDSECDQQRKDEFGHELTVVTWRNAGGVTTPATFGVSVNPSGLAPELK